MSDTYDTDDTYESDGSESPVLNEARKAARKAEKEAKELRAKLEEYEKRETTARETATEQIVNALGLPGLKNDVLDWVEGDITEESVVAALKQRSIPLPDSVAESVDAEPQNEPVGRAATVGQRVAEVASGTDGRSLEEKIAQATSQREINELMAEAGLTRSHS